jgi:nicotinamidase/pyrazinamidase
MADPRTGDAVPTELEALLRDREVGRLVVAGLATDYCVRATVLDARALGLPVTVLTAAVRAVDLSAGDGERAFDEMRAAGAVLEDGRGPAGTLRPS